MKDSRFPRIGKRLSVYIRREPDAGEGGESPLFPFGGGLILKEYTCREGQQLAYRTFLLALWAVRGLHPLRWRAP